MTTQLEQAARLALEALEALEQHGTPWLHHETPYRNAITALRAALEQPAQDELTRSQKLRDAGITRRPKGWDKDKDDEQPAQDEPVAWGVEWGKAGEIPCVSIIKRLPDGSIEVVACEYGPQAREWVGLTDEERTEIRSKVQVYTAMDNIQYGLAIQRATETKLKEKNT